MRKQDYGPKGASKRWNGFYWTASETQGEHSLLSPKLNRVYHRKRSRGFPQKPRTQLGILKLLGGFRGLEIDL